MDFCSSGNQYSGQYGPGRSQYGSVGNVSQNSAGPAPTTKPPTPPQNRFPSGSGGMLLWRIFCRKLCAILCMYCTSGSQYFGIPDPDPRCQIFTKNCKIKLSSHISNLNGEWKKNNLKIHLFFK